MRLVKGPRRLPHRPLKYPRPKAPAIREINYVRVLLTEHQIAEAVERLAREIAEFYAPNPLTLIGILTGSLVFVADLIRQLDLPLRVGLVQARSYRGAATTPGELTINTDLLPDIVGQDVLLADDIFDTGHTLATLVEQLHSLGARSVRSAVLLYKQGRQQVHLHPEHVGIEIPNEFVVGYGLDYQDAYRHLPYVAILEPLDLEQT
jgi:hypoxanthine phosphoribosyltransferase